MKTMFRGIAAAVLGCALLTACDGSPTATEPAPDLTGIWVGTLTHSADGTTPVWQVRLDLTELDGNADGYLVGDLRTYFQNALLRVGVSGDVSTADVELTEGQLRESSGLPSGRYWCRERTFKLKYRRVDGRDRLAGRWTTPTSGCVGGEITLTRQ